MLESVNTVWTARRVHVPPHGRLLRQKTYQRHVGSTSIIKVSLWRAVSKFTVDEYKEGIIFPIYPDCHLLPAS